MIGLRARTAAALAIGGLIVSVTLGVLAYELARGYLIDKRVELVERETMVNAVFADGALNRDSEPVGDVVDAVSDQLSPVLVEQDGRWFGTVVGLGEADVPSELRELVGEGAPATAFTVVDGDPAIVAAAVLPNSGARFYQFFPLIELESTLAAIRTSLALGALITTIGSALFGLAVSRRVLRPLRDVADTAERIADGDLSARLEDGRDPDLVPLVSSFNHMADALDERIERERRFAADVSHELRTPLTAMTSAVHLIERRADQLSGNGQQAVDVLRSQVERFSRLVLEILDLSRLEADLADVNIEHVDLRGLLRVVVTENGLSPAVLDVDPDVPERLPTDPRRLRVILRNLLENATRYGDGCVRLGVRPDGEQVVLEIDDAGPGLAGDDPALLFERFHRGSVAIDRGTGTGLGLALVAENARALGGAVVAGDAPAGGARFSVRLPLERHAEVDVAAVGTGSA